MSDHNIGEGNVEMELDGELITLKPTLKAALALSNGQGGIPAMVQRCINLEMDALCSVISHGLGVWSKDIPEKVYKTGLFQVSGRCIRFLNVVSNGGRPLNDEEEKEGDGTATPLEQNN